MEENVSRDNYNKLLSLNKSKNYPQLSEFICEAFFEILINSESDSRADLKFWDKAPFERVSDYNPKAYYGLENEKQGFIFCTYSHNKQKTSELRFSFNGNSMVWGFLFLKKPEKTTPKHDTESVITSASLVGQKNCWSHHFDSNTNFSRIFLLPEIDQIDFPFEEYLKSWDEEARNNNKLIACIGFILIKAFLPFLSLGKQHIFQLNQIVFQNPQNQQLETQIANEIEVITFLEKLQSKTLPCEEIQSEMPRILALALAMHPVTNAQIKEFYRLSVENMKAEIQRYDFVSRMVARASSKFPWLTVNVVNQVNFQESGFIDKYPSWNAGFITDLFLKGKSNGQKTSNLPDYRIIERLFSLNHDPKTNQFEPLDPKHKKCEIPLSAFQKFTSGIQKHQIDLITEANQPEQETTVLQELQEPETLKETENSDDSEEEELDPKPKKQKQKKEEPVTTKDKKQTKKKVVKNRKKAAKGKTSNPCKGCQKYSQSQLPELWVQTIGHYCRTCLLQFETEDYRFYQYDKFKSEKDKKEIFNKCLAIENYKISTWRYGKGLGCLFNIKNNTLLMEAV